MLLTQVAAPTQPSQSALSAPTGVTILESRDLQAQLTDAKQQLAKGKLRIAVATLQKILEADNEALVKVDEQDWLFHGASNLAAKLLKELPKDAATIRESIIGKRAAEELLFAISPPNPQLLARLTQRYSGTIAGERAQAALNEILRDRGLYEMAPPSVGSTLQTPAWTEKQENPLPYLHTADLEERWRYQFQDSPIPHRNYAKHRAALGLGMVYLSDSREVVALDLASGKVRWRFESPEGWERFSLDSASGRSARENITEAFDADTIIAPILSDGILVVALQEAVALGRNDKYFEIAVRRLLPGRRLYAFDAQSGKLLWKQSVPWMDLEQSSEDLANARQNPSELAAAPPTVAAGRVFLPIYSASGTYDLSMVALDLYSGKELWRSFLVSGSQESNLFGNVLGELACSPPIASSEQVICCTNLGAISALDARNGSALWTRLYERTPTQVLQSGDISRRQPSFANHAPAWDGKRLLCAPTDSPYALLLDSHTGELNAMWSSKTSAKNESASIDQVIALAGEQLYFTGTHIRGEAIGGRNFGWNSERIFNQFSSIATRRPAILSSDELLAPTAKGLLRINPQTGKLIGAPIPWPNSLSDFGAIQLAPGHLLVLRNNGVIALSSSIGVLAAIPDNANFAELSRLLPMLEAIPLEYGSTIATQLGEQCLQLSQQTEHSGLQRRLLLIAGEALLLSSPNSQKTQKLALDLLKSNSPDIKLICESVIAHCDVGPALRRAIDWLEQNKIENFNQVQLNLARSRIAVEDQNKDLLRLSLVAIIIDPDSQKLMRDDLSLNLWAQQQLDSLLTDPVQAAAFEEAARIALGASELDLRLIDVYQNTATISAWIEEQLQRSDLLPKDFATIIQSTRKSGKFPTLVNDKLGEWLSPRPLQELPQKLNQLAQLPLSRGQLLAVGPSQDDYLRALFQISDQVVLKQSQGNSWKTLCSWEIDYQTGSPPDLRSSCWLSPRGAVIIFEDQWVQLGNDGGVEVITLPAKLNMASAPSRSGNILSYLCANPQSTFLQTRELQSGALIYQESFSNSGSSYLLSGDQNKIFISQPGEREIWMLDLSSANPPQRLGLREAIKYSDAFTIVGHANGLLSKWSNNQHPGMMLSAPQQQQSWDISRHANVHTFSCRTKTTTGAGWINLPLVPGRGEFPNPEINWLESAASLNSISMLKPQAYFPQFLNHSRRPRHLRRSQILSLSAGPENQVRLNAIELSDGLDNAWELEIPGLLFRTLISRRTPTPIEAADGWLLATINSSGIGKAPRLQINAVSENGKLTSAVLQMPVSTQSRDLSIHFINQRIVVRSGSTLFIFGQK